MLDFSLFFVAVAVFFKSVIQEKIDAITNIDSWITFFLQPCLFYFIRHIVNATFFFDKY